MKRSKTAIGIAAIVATLAIAAVAFAHGKHGRHMGGYGEGFMMGQRYDGDDRMDNDPCHVPCMRRYGRWQGLSDEEAAKVEEKRDKFFDETRELRRSIDSKRSAMRSEMGKDNPDQEKVLKLQKELSALDAEFDQKALAHRLEMRKLFPENYKDINFGRYNKRGRGYCW
jgi:Spy/CpxP family protein refolding chaperone